MSVPAQWILCSHRHNFVYNYRKHSPTALHADVEHRVLTLDHLPSGYRGLMRNSGLLAILNRRTGRPRIQDGSRGILERTRILRRAMSGHDPVDSALRRYCRTIIRFITPLRSAAT